MTASLEKRLNKYISDSGFCSRREADRLVEQNRVTINGQTPELGTKVQPGDYVQVDGQEIVPVAEDKTDRIYIAYHKPIGITCTTEHQVKGNIIDAIKHPQRIFPIGRLDKPSEGLIFLTSDGDIVNKILRAENAHDKEYVVTVDTPLREDFVAKMSGEIPILDTLTKPCEVNTNSRYEFTIILTQGLNRQIRRMAEYLGYRVTRLKRTRIMNVTLDGLRPGQWRDLTDSEMQILNQAVSGSTKVASHQGTPKYAVGSNPNKQTPSKQDRSKKEQSQARTTQHRTRGNLTTERASKGRKTESTGRPNRGDPSDKPTKRSRPTLSKRR